MARTLTGERLEKELLRLEAMKAYEKENEDCALICGIDEAGRGPLAGPVAAGAVILPRDCTILYLNDSKKLSEKRREELFLEIKEKALAWNVAVVSPARIDEINILQATYEAMRAAIGIEALSRGASEAVFIDNGIRQVSCIRDNLKTTKLESGAKVLNCGVLEGLSRLGRDHGAFDFIFMDPPYGCDLERQVLEALQDSPLADGDTVLIAEASLDTDFSWAESLGYEISRTKEYKTNKHVFFKKREN